MAEKKKTQASANKGVTLKRSVTIKAIVTDKFKQYLMYELQTSIDQATKQLEQLEKEAEKIEAESKSKTPKINVEASYRQLETERTKIVSTIEDIKKRIEHTKTLKNDDEYIQGVVDGFVNINQGDNLYEKLGGMEIIVKDGVVDQIVPVAAIPPKK